MVQLQKDVSDSTIVSHQSEARGQFEIEGRLSQEHNKQKEYSRKFRPFKKP